MSYHEFHEPVEEMPEREDPVLDAKKAIAASLKYEIVGLFNTLSCLTNPHVLPLLKDLISEVERSRTPAKK